LTAFFNVRKRCDEGQALKKRKVETLDGLEARTTSATSLSLPEIQSSTPISSAAKEAPTNGRRRKKETAPAAAEADKVLFTMGSKSAAGATPGTKAKRRLNMDGEETKAATDKKAVSFVKAGNLSPKKSRPNVTFEKMAPLSPKKAPLSPQKTLEFKAPVAAEGKTAFEDKVAASSSKVMDALNKMPAKEVKAKIKTVNKLADLQAQLRELKKDKNLTAKRALFQDGGSTSSSAAKKEPTAKAASLIPPASPQKLLEDHAPKAAAAATAISSPSKTGPKASPRKAIPAFVRYQELAQPDKYLPLPNRYKSLSEIFRNLDIIVSMKFNRQEMIRVPDLKPAMQNITRKTFSEFYLRQIRCVFPKAYKYIWEKVKDRLGRHTGDFVLHMSPDQGVKAGATLSPQIKVERMKMFQHALLNIVHDYHRDFLTKIGITGISDDVVTKWHKDFKLEEVPDIDEEELPAKPDVEEKVRNPKEMLAKLAGVNERLEQSLNALQTAKVDEKVAAAAAAAAPKIRKELKGLRPELIQKILANEKAKQIRDMTQSTEERKDLEQLKELVDIAPVIINCHRSHRKGAVVALDTLAAVTADSHGRKSKQSMLQLIQTFLRLVPECMEVKTIERTKYVKLLRTSPDVNQVKKIIENLVEKAAKK